MQPSPASQNAPSPSYAQLANAIRALAMDAVEAAKSGHPGMPMGVADMAAVLWGKFLKFNPADPTWADRDRFILSAGHGSMLLYAVNYLTGYKKITIDEIKKFRQLHAITAGHPEVMPDAGIEMTTGPLGQGIATSVGFALGERVMNARFGEELASHYTYVIASDGDLMEGISHEAASLAGHLKLGKLIVLYDDNEISIDGPTSLSFSEDTLKRFDSYGWHTTRIDGHNHDAIEAAITAAQKDGRPSLIACRTIIGYGAPKKSGSKDCHGSPLGADEITGTRAKLGWTHEAFVVPPDLLDTWRGFGTRCLPEYNAWQKRLQTSAKAKEFTTAMKGELPAGLNDAITALKKKIASDKPKVATRQASGTVLETLLPLIPEMIGGSADLTGSNNTIVKGFGALNAANYAGRYIHYGVREHGMAACMNGLALHGGVMPYSGTFLQFADYSRPAIRLGALMKTQVVHVMTHDSIGLGEDGPTHQPVEHLSALRAIPNLMVMRPCDTVEAAECWQIALQNKTTPSLMALSRQNVPTLRTDGAEENKSAKGGYIMWGHTNPRVTFIATGSEVMLAVEAAEKLHAEGFQANVVSMPCMELFQKQDAAYKQSVLGKAPRIVIEAGLQMSWDKYLRETDGFIGMTGFGESAPAPELYKHFGITTDAAIALAKKLAA